MSEITYSLLTVELYFCDYLISRSFYLITTNMSVLIIAKKWIGYTFSRDSKQNPKQVLDWNPREKCKPS